LLAAPGPGPVKQLEDIVPHVVLARILAQHDLGDNTLVDAHPGRRGKFMKVISAIRLFPCAGASYRKTFSNRLTVSFHPD
jgi:hypothetical protein